MPQEVIDWVRACFDEANRNVTESLINNPNMHETTLDDALLAPLSRRQAPVKFPSGTVVRMEVHNVGGLRRLYHWEVADIAVVVTVFRGGMLQGEKIGVLQAKRLYPMNNEVLDADPVGYRSGLNGLLFPDPNTALSRMRRTFEFTEECHYQALKAKDEQCRVIEDFNQQFGEAAYYLFYNPPIVPETVNFPIDAYQTLSTPPSLGVRVVRASDVHTALDRLDEGKTPTLKSIIETASPHERLEDWAANLLLCNVGVIFDSSKEDTINRLIVRRSGPIGAAIAISIALSDSAD